MIMTQVLHTDAVITALETHLAMIEFNLNKEVIWVNRNFASAMGYRPEEMSGMKHQSFCTDAFQKSEEYKALWSNLKKGKKFQEKIERVSKNGSLLWFEATYIPVADETGEVTAVLKIATNITEQENRTLNIISELKSMPEELAELVVANTKESSQAVLALQKQTDLISQTSKAISHISSQTNMVALNAAIEAARVGEQGKGFKVVADEIRRLSTSVDEAIDKVNSNVEHITKEAHKVSSLTNTLQAIIQETQIKFTATITEFEGAAT
ncbi:PAS domain S-box protein [Bacillus sp. FJAT-42376]|uniref:methyl-accepting chemotaxis protein n=1 Tax=Bacillus sp. FJAT-42376 TaxID=2014076 RepID=UPI000F4F63B9|nr:methyl-accepting chemotaxis protein [Bacillus sp. FJAT-42376]AZB41472.1 PAS domain S-box protein [Bacillus sp. FJAT-42376]